MLNSIKVGDLVKTAGGIIGKIINIIKVLIAKLNPANLLDKQPIIIPQTMAGNLVVKYTIASTDGSKFTETKAVALSGLAGSGVWQPGKKYTYTITIGTSEILIDPTVADWVPVEANLPI